MYNKPTITLSLSTAELARMVEQGVAGAWIEEQLKAAQDSGAWLLVYLDGIEADLVDIVDAFELGDDVMYCETDECHVCGTAWRMPYRSCDGSERLGYCTCCDTLIAFVEDPDEFPHEQYNAEADPEEDHTHMEDWLLCD